MSDILQNQINALMGRGKILRGLEKYDQARQVYYQAIELAPNHPNPVLCLVDCLRKIGSFDEASLVLKNAQSRISNNSDLLKAEGVLLRESGKIEEAVKSFSRALESDPNNPEAFYSLVNIKKIDPTSLPILKEWEGRVEQPSDLNLPAIFGLGKAYDDLGERHKAFHYWQRGNSLVRKNLVFSPLRFQKEVSALKTLNNKWLMEVRKKLSPQKSQPTPIFIVGMPRTGSTLLEQILATNPEIKAAGELRHLPNILFSPYKGDLVAWATAMRDPNIEFLRDSTERYLSHLNTLGETQYVTDKMLGNIFFIPAILAMFPDAKILYCQRDPIDMCWSIYRHYFRELPTYVWDLKEIAIYYQEVRSLMQHWAAEFGSSILNIHYEKLVENPEAVLRPILASMGLEWTDACLRFHENKNVVRTASSAQVRQPLYKHGIGQWKPYEQYLGPLKEALGL